MRHDGRDPQEYGARFLDAFVDACRRLLTVEVLPESHGSTPRITLTMDYTDLASGIGCDSRHRRHPLRDTVRRLACDADLVPMVLGSRRARCWTSAAQRLVTPAIWKALLVRDGMRFPGCRRPPVACDAHRGTGGRRGHQPRQPRPGLPDAPHHAAQHTVGDPAQPGGPETGVPPTTA